VKEPPAATAMASTARAHVRDRKKTRAFRTLFHLLPSTKLAERARKGKACRGG